MEIIGTGRTAQAIRAMVVPHAGELDAFFSARTESTPGGVSLTAPLLGTRLALRD